MNGTGKPPSRWYYAIGFVVLVIGIAAFVIFLLTKISGALPQIQVVVPGTHQVSLSQPGKYTIFYEYRSVIDNKVYLTGKSLPGEMLVGLKFRDSSQKISLSRPSMSGEYEQGGRAGVSILEFEISEPGSYILTTHYAEGVDGPDVVLAVGQLKLVGTILGGLAIFFTTLIISAFIIIRTFIKRRKANKLAND